MNYTILDVETTTSNKGNPFDQTNKLVVIGVRSNGTEIVQGGTNDCYWETPKSAWSFDGLRGMMLMSNPPKNAFSYYMRQKDWVVLFNAKFDLHWIRKERLSIEGWNIWDCQLAEFILSSQENKMPSLDECLEKYGLPPKLDHIKINYWDKGIDTKDIPRKELREYLNRDLEATEELFIEQHKMFETTYKHLFPLFKLHCQDLLVLEEMEWNGIVFREEKARAKAKEINEEQIKLKSKMDCIVGSIPYSLTSDTDMSSVIYGGLILKEDKIPVGVFKTGAKVGQTRYKKIYNTYECEGMVKPLKKTESHTKVAQKELDFVDRGVLPYVRKYWKVDEKTLKKVKKNKKAKEFLSLYAEYNKLEKLRNTGLVGCSDFITKLNLEKDRLHPNLNQCVAITGRLSSSQPNGQNLDDTTKRFCESRYI